jgi:hypothetical protein
VFWLASKQMDDLLQPSFPVITCAGSHCVELGDGVLQKPFEQTCPSAQGDSGQVETVLLWQSLSPSVSQNWSAAQSPFEVQP